MVVHGSFVVPSVKCLVSSSYPSSANYLVAIYPGVMYHYDGSYLVMHCTSRGATPQVSEMYSADQGLFSLPSQDKVSVGDKIRVTVSFTFSSGALSIVIKDSSKRWSFISSGLIDSSGSTVAAMWLLIGPNSFILPQKFTPIRTTADSATIGTHTGTLGSFSSITSDFVEGFNYIDSSDKVLALTSPLSSSGNAFVITWKAAS